MNALCYKVVFSQRLGALVAVGEHTAGQGKATGSGVRNVVLPAKALGGQALQLIGTLRCLLVASVLACTTAGACWAAPLANALPTGGVVQPGAANIVTTNAAMTITQNSDKASIDWQSFNIGSDASVTVMQPSTHAVLLNRVVGNDPSQIFGSLSANGQVILINPNGVVFGQGGRVTASAFTASTFGLTDANFQAGKYIYERGSSTAGVTVENGAAIRTSSPGGYVALLGATVNNKGTIETQQGAVVMASGNQVTLPAAPVQSVGVPLSNRVRLELETTILNAGIENSGTITTHGGQVLMQSAGVADAVALITQSGTIDTTGDAGANAGDVVLQSQGGKVSINGSAVIKGHNITLDNTGGSFDDAGQFTRGEKVGTSQGVYITGNVNAAGALNIAGATNGTGAAGVQIQGGNSTLTTTGKSVSIYGSSSWQQGVFLINAKVKATDGDLKVTGVSDLSNGLRFSNNSNNSLDATAGNVNITAESDSGTAIDLVAGHVLAQGSSGSAPTGGDITITADSLSLGATVNANDGKGAVTVQNKTAGTLVTLGGADNTAANSKTLGLSTGELSKITAAKLTVGSSTAGGLNVDRAITRAGNIALVAGGTVKVNAQLTTTANANANGDISITANTSQGDAIVVGANVTAAGDVNLSGTTAGSGDTLNAAIRSTATVKGDNITMLAQGTATTGTTLGYYGAGVGAKFVADGDLKLTANSANEGAGFYMFRGALEGKNIVIDGQSANAQGVSLDNNASVVSQGKLTINGKASAGKSAISLRGANLMAQGDVTLAATGGGDIAADSTPNPNWIGTTLINRITQNNTTNGKVTLTSTGTGHITVPMIINKSKDDVVIAAGADLTGDAAGASTGAGGQVRTVRGNTITQADGGNTYVYAGNAASTGDLSLLGVFGSDLYLSPIGSNLQNVASNTAYAANGTQTPISSGARAQVIFRDKVALSGTLNNATITYGDAVSATALAEAFQVSNPSTANGGTVTTQTSAGKLHVLTADVIADSAKGNVSLASALNNPDNLSSSNNLKANAEGYAVEMTGSQFALTGMSAKLMVKQKELSASYQAADKAYDGTNKATVTGRMTGLVQGDQVTLLHTDANFSDATVANDKTVTVTGVALRSDNAKNDAANYTLKTNAPAAPTTASTKANLTPAAPVPPTPSPITPAVKVKDPVIPANPFQLASADDLASDICSANSLENCHCEESSSNNGVGICYEPGSANKGSER
jgi:filamentous hemagglutinin family protein